MQIKKETMNVYEIFDNLRYHHENEVVELKKRRTGSTSMELTIWF